MSARTLTCFARHVPRHAGLGLQTRPGRAELRTFFWVTVLYTRYMYVYQIITYMNSHV